MEAAVHEQQAMELSVARVWSVPALIDRIAGFLSANDIACGLRPVNKAMVSQFRSHTTVHLSCPSPPSTFAAHWEAPGAAAAYNLEQRRQFVCLTAASGCIPNLEVAVRLEGASVHVLAAAAGAGQLDACQWLLSNKCPADSRALAAAAGAGHFSCLNLLLEATGPTALSDGVLEAAASKGRRDMCETLLAKGCSWSFWTIVAAARGGHAALAEWLLQELMAPGGPAAAPDAGAYTLLADYGPAGGAAAAGPPPDPNPPPHPAAASTDTTLLLLLFEGACTGCDLATMKYLHRRLFPAGPPVTQLPHTVGSRLAAAAAISPISTTTAATATFPTTAATSAAPGIVTDTAAAAAPTAASTAAPTAAPTTATGAGDYKSKVEWLLGGPTGRAGALPTRVCDAVASMQPDRQAAERLRWLRVEKRFPISPAALCFAAQAGNTEALRYLLDPELKVQVDVDPDRQAPSAMLLAAEEGRLEAVQLLVERLGYGTEPAATTAAAAPAVGSSSSTPTSSKKAAKKQQQVKRKPLSAALMACAARSGRLDLMTWLHARGGRWRRDESGEGAFKSCVAAGCEQAVRWLAAQGCPMGTEGEPYLVAALQCDLRLLGCLRDIGCPWSSSGLLFDAAVQNGEVRLTALRWLLKAGCVVVWASAEKAARLRSGRDRAEVLRWVREQAAAAAVTRGVRGVVV